MVWWPGNAGFSFLFPGNQHTRATTITPQTFRTRTTPLDDE